MDCIAEVLQPKTDGTETTQNMQREGAGGK